MSRSKRRWVGHLVLFIALCCSSCGHKPGESPEDKACSESLESLIRETNSVYDNLRVKENSLDQVRLFEARYFYEDYIDQLGALRSKLASMFLTEWYTPSRPMIDKYFELSLEMLQKRSAMLSLIGELHSALQTSEELALEAMLMGPFPLLYDELRRMSKAVEGASSSTRVSTTRYNLIRAKQDYTTCADRFIIEKREINAYNVTRMITEIFEWDSFFFDSSDVLKKYYSAVWDKEWDYDWNALLNLSD